MLAYKNAHSGSWVLMAGCIQCDNSCDCLPAVQSKIYSPDQLNELVAASDYVVVATPYTPATHQLINAAAIAAMKPTGVLINVGRGKCIDEAALIEGERPGSDSRQVYLQLLP
eukprot:GHUV01026235.1.p2 GENE.GHUV01026235.1~~GHUV01026235.1.p2  ORF type:complete len:113 (-),score=33.82 GHUV01026235.1:489-827(-)